MPHLITHRPRLSNLASSDETDGSHKAWETFSALSYEVGGLTFIGGSVLFLPAFSAYVVAGDWLFFAGSMLYLLVTGHELLEVIKYWRLHNAGTSAAHIEFFTASCYAFASILFVVGSLCFLPRLDAVGLGAWLFIIGSALFLVGGLINVLEVVQAPSMIYMQLFGFTLALFAVGSALFGVATIPYLWQLNSVAEHRVTTFAASQFVFASALFWIGGLAIYYRKLVRDKLEDFCHVTGLGTMFIRELQNELPDQNRFKKDEPE